MLIGFYLSIYQSVISEISGMFGTGGALTGIMIALYFTGAFLSPIVCGELGDRIGKKPVLLAGFIVLTTGVIIVALSKHVLITCAGIFLMGGWPHCLSISIRNGRTRVQILTPMTIAHGRPRSYLFF